MTHSRAYAEIDLSSCPYYQGTGKCQSGCYSEPSCMTDEPLEGWPSRRSMWAKARAWVRIALWPWWGAYRK